MRFLNQEDKKEMKLVFVTLKPRQYMLPLIPRVGVLVAVAIRFIW